MRLDSREPSSPRGVFLDAATGQPVRWVIWADLADDPALESEYEAFRSDPREALRAGVLPGTLRYRGRARLRFIPAAPLFRVKPTDPRDLAGSLVEGRQRFRKARPLIFVPGTDHPECDEPLCHQPAAWSVSDEQEIEPERDAEGRLHERAITVRPRFYCSAHYRAPTFCNVRGVESEVPEEVARPQW